MYCVGLRWCDGRNLQLMCGIQGLYHDTDGGLNFLIARHRLLCCLGSVAVVGSQLAFPLVLAVESRPLRLLGFAFAMSFHASNHILWRINFFVGWCASLLALVVPGPQMPLSAIATSPGALAPMAVVAVYLLMQLGHALDLATEKALARSGAWLASRATAPLATLGLRLIWLAELHCLGDYYSSYWPTSHPLRGEPVAVVLAVYEDGGARQVPAVTDFYWRRDMSSGVKWPRSKAGQCEVKVWEGWSDAKGNAGALQAARGAVAVNALMPAAKRSVAEVVAALTAQLDESFLGPTMARRLTQAKAKLVLRARVLEEEGDGYRVRTLWECALRTAGDDARRASPRKAASPMRARKMAAAGAGKAKGAE